MSADQPDDLSACSPIDTNSTVCEDLGAQCIQIKMTTGTCEKCGYTIAAMLKCECRLGKCSVCEDNGPYCTCDLKQSDECDAALESLKTIRSCVETYLPESTAHGLQRRLDRVEKYLNAPLRVAQLPTECSRDEKAYSEFKLMYRENGGVGMGHPETDHRFRKCLDAYDAAKSSPGRPNELALDILRLTKTLRFIQGIVERGENRRLGDDECVDIAILQYVKKLEDSETIQQEHYMRGWKEAQAHYTKRESVSQPVATAYQLGYSHGANQMQPLTTEQGIEAMGITKP